MATVEQERNADRVVQRIMEDLDKVLNAYEAENVPKEICVVALLSLMWTRADSIDIPDSRIAAALDTLAEGRT